MAVDRSCGVRPARVVHADGSSRAVVQVFGEGGEQIMLLDAALIGQFTGSITEAAVQAIAAAREANRDLHPLAGVQTEGRA